MSGIHAKFLQENAEKYGFPAEEAVINYLKSKSNILSITQYPFGKYDVDLRIVTNVGYYYADVEHRGKYWLQDKDEFPFDTINIPSRKEKMIRSRIPFLYFIVRGGFDRMLVLTGESILHSPKFENPNQRIKAGEIFFSVNKNKILFYSDLK